ncbi:MAG: hypothetical protein M3P98_00460 [bacterium]|nr:hypothetical protein [bacterium]
MRKSITQKNDFGCGIACFAFAANVSYEQAEAWLGQEQANSNRFYVKDFRKALIKHGLNYSSKHMKPQNRQLLKKDGAIVLIRRSKNYPSGHYLIRYENTWMDPWINLRIDNNIANAESGFRKQLPGSAMYVLYPEL